MCHAMVGLTLAALMGLGWGAVQKLAAPQVSPSPVVDGHPDDEVWSQAAVLSLTRRLGDGHVAVGTEVRVCWGEDRLFVLFLCDEPQPALMRRVVRRHDGEVWTDDCVEIFLAPDPDAPDRYYHIAVNSVGFVRDEFWQSGNDDVGWQSHAQIGTRVEKQRWVAEVGIPLRSLNRVPVVSDTWKVNFARQRYATSPPELSTWRPCRHSFHEPQNFGAFTFAGIAASPSVRRFSADFVRQEVQRLQETLRQWQQRLPSQPRTSMGKQTAALIADWLRQLAADDGLAMWRRVKAMQSGLPKLATMFAQAQTAERLRRPYAVFAVSPMVKLRPEQIPQGEPLGARNAIEIFAAKGEGESVQLVVTALARSLKRVTVRVTALRGPKSASVVPAVRLVGYVPVQKPTPGGFGVAGRYPDPLLPLTEFDVPQGEGRAVWLTVWTPADVPAGDYKGALTIEPQNAAAMTVPVRLRVYDVTLPAQSFLKTCVLIWDDKARQVYGDAWTPERRRRFYELCLRYRFTPPPPLPWDKVFFKRADGTWAAEWDEFDRTVDEWMRKGATAFAVGDILRWGTHLPPEDRRDEVAAKLRLLGAHLQQKGWSERFYFYVFDEPSTAAFADIEALCRFVHQHAPNLNILLTAGYGATGAFRAHAPTLDGAAYRALANFINIWVPHIDCFDEPFLRERRRSGDQVWMYVCISTAGKTYPDIWRIDWTGVAHRAIGWWLWRYGCEGFLYWCVNYWTDDKGNPFNLFADPIAYPGGNGDGFLFYPDPAKGDPIPSVRAELFRDGIEDYDLLHLLRERWQRVQADNRKTTASAAWLAQAVRLLRVDDIIRATNKFVDDPQVYATRHRQLLTVLERWRP
ncbi:hypothetical protein HRbin17_02789 [bacterium HR17]|uniref:Glycoside hydrolase 123 C-terminal domain-containing protein n=1 Tax=Candidatus Fervidibacter japonicus TaxID=2035412 RepID=A0A2H5XGE9_9BACT|nr:hypothetical protein HRbin17_02789 [bacterium HR17]